MPRDLASRLTRYIRVERPVPDDSFAGAGAGAWQLFTSVWAEVQDALPSRAETSGQGFTNMTRPSRVRIRYRPDITPDMRFVMDGREMHIVSGPAEIGRREALEFMVAEYIPTGGGA